MLFKDISYLELWQPLCNFGRVHHEEQFEFGPLDQEEMSSKNISYLELWWPLCLAELSHLCNLCRMYHEE